MNDLQTTIISSICSGVAGALAGGLFTLLIERKKSKNSFLVERQKELKDEYDKRPRLEIKEYKDIEEGDVYTDADLNCILLNFDNPIDNNGNLFFPYDRLALEKDNLCCVEYVFENTGKTEIDDVCLVSTQPHTTSVTKLSSKDFLIENGILSYEAWSDKRFIKPGERISIKIYFLKNKIIVSPVGSIVSIYMQDINGNLWRQELFCPTKEIENSTRASFVDFKTERNINSALDFFKDHIGYKR